MRVIVCNGLKLRVYVREHVSQSAPRERSVASRFTLSFDHRLEVVKEILSSLGEKKKFQVMITANKNAELCF